MYTNTFQSKTPRPTDRGGNAAREGGRAELGFLERTGRATVSGAPRFLLSHDDTPQAGQHSDTRFFFDLVHLRARHRATDRLVLVPFPRRQSREGVRPRELGPRFARSRVNSTRIHTQPPAVPRPPSRRLRGAAPPPLLTWR